MMRKSLWTLLLLCSITVGAAPARESLAEDNLLDQVDYDRVPLRIVIKEIRTRSKMPVAIQTGNSELLNHPVTLHLSAVPPEDVLRYAAMAAGLGFEVDEHGRMTVCDRDRLLTRFFQVEIIDREITSAGLQAFFSTGGVEFPPGSRIEYNRRNSTLTSVNTADSQRRIGLIIGGRTPRGAPRLRLIPSLAVIGNLEIAAKLDAIRIGPEKKDTMSLQQIFALAHESSMANDPEGAGVNFVLSPEVKAEETTLTLGLSKMTLREFLHTICAAAGLQWRYDDFAVFIYPKSVLPVPSGNEAVPNSKATPPKNKPPMKLVGEDAFEK